MKILFLSKVYFAFETNKQDNRWQHHTCRYKFRKCSLAGSWAEHCDWDAVTWLWDCLVSAPRDTDKQLSHFCGNYMLMKTQIFSLQVVSIFSVTRKLHFLSHDKLSRLIDSLPLVHFDALTNVKCGRRRKAASRSRFDRIASSLLASSGAVSFHRRWHAKRAEACEGDLSRAVGWERVIGSLFRVWKKKPNN